MCCALNETVFAIAPAQKTADATMAARMPRSSHPDIGASIEEHYNH